MVFRDKPLELWDIRTCTLLREMAKNFPAVTALVWTSICHLQCSAMFISSVYVLCLSAMFMSVCMWLYKCICSNSYRIAKHDTIPVRQLSLSPMYLIRLILKLLWGLASRFWSISTIRLLGNNQELMRIESSHVRSVIKSGLTVLNVGKSVWIHVLTAIQLLMNIFEFSTGLACIVFYHLPDDLSIFPCSAVILMGYGMQMIPCWTELGKKVFIFQAVEDK